MPSRLLPRGAAAAPIHWGPATTRAPEAWTTSPPAANDGAPVNQALQATIQGLQEDMQAREQAAFQRGLASGVQQERGRIDPVLARLARTITDLGEARAKALAEADHDIVQLAVAVARRVLRRELTVDPDSLAGIVKAALERIAARETQRVRVHPEDAGCVERHMKSAGAPPRIEVCPDSSLERGSVIFETARGNLDTSVSTQLSEIERGLTDMLRRRNA